MGSFDEARKAIQDILAPELRGIAVRLDGIDKRMDLMHTDQGLLREELRAVESRMTAAIDQAKREILLQVQLADMEQRNALLQRKVSELEQKSPQ